MPPIQHLLPRYNNWHNHPYHKRFHWFLFGCAILIASTIISFQVIGLYYYKANFTEAQTVSLPASSRQLSFGYYFGYSKFGMYGDEVQGYTNMQMVDQTQYLWPDTPENIAGTNQTAISQIREALQKAIATGARDIVYHVVSIRSPESDIQLGWHAGIEAARPYWNNIDYIILADEPPWNADLTTNTINAFDALVASKGLANKPIVIVYHDGNLTKNNGWQASNLDIVGIETYIHWDDQNNPNIVNMLNAKIDQYMTLTGNRQVVFIPMSYDRNTAWKNMDSLIKVQYPPYLKAYNNSRVIGLWMFSYGRAGGTRDITQYLTPAHKCIWNAINGIAGNCPDSFSGGKTPLSSTMQCGSTTVAPIWDSYKVNSCWIPEDPNDETWTLGRDGYVGPNAMSCLRTPYVANWWCVNACGGTWASSFTDTRDRANTSTLKGIPDGSTCPGCEYILTGITCVGGDGGDGGDGGEDGGEYIPPGDIPPKTSPYPCETSSIVSGIIVICDIFPIEVLPGGGVQLSGSNLGATVILNSSNGTTRTIYGTLNPELTLLSLSIPTDIPVGTYSIAVQNGSQTAVSSQKISIVNQLSSSFSAQSDAEPFAQNNTPLTVPITEMTFNELITWLFDTAVIVVGIAVFVMILWGGFLWMTSAANPGNIATAKRYITNAIIGAILLIASYAILYTINPQFVGGEFKLGNLKLISPGSQSTNEPERYVAINNELAAASAIISGCTLKLDFRNITAVECPEDFPGAMGLIPDPQLYAQDINVNQKIGATSVQSSGNIGSGVKVAILDTGINYNHPELKSSYIGGRDFVNNDDDPMDDNNSGAGHPGHGSHVAGIIAADGINTEAKGVAPGAQIISGKILNSVGDGNWSIMTRAIYWAVDGLDKIHGNADDPGTNIINISIGGSPDFSFCNNKDQTAIDLAKAIKYAKDNGVLVVVAAGNNSSGVMMPGCIDEALTVGATDNSNNIFSRSGRGAGVDVVAPGINVFSPELNNAYIYKTGTSMATPVVSGLAALIKSAFPGYNAKQIENAITSTAVDLGPTGKDTTYGWGAVTTNSLTGTLPPPPSTPNGSIILQPASCTKASIAGNPNCTINIQASASGINAPETINIRVNTNQIGSINCTTSSCSNNITFTPSSAGTYNITLVLNSNNSQIGQSTAYIYTTGTLTSNFNYCTKGSDAINPNCNITLNITAPGITPGSILVKKDGINWRTLSCSNASCSQTVTDSDPTPGIHTYTLFDSSNGIKLARATVTIQAPSGVLCTQSSGQQIEFCTGINFTGLCESFTCKEIADFDGTTLQGQTILSARMTGSGSSRIFNCAGWTCPSGGCHPYTPDTRIPPPYICAWRELNQNAPIGNIWNNSNNWCGWSWIDGVPVTKCGYPEPTGPEETNIQSYDF